MFLSPMVTTASSRVPGETADTSHMDVILDILVGLLDKASNDLRNFANLVFGMVASGFTSSSLRHLVAVSWAAWQAHLADKYIM